MGVARVLLDQGWVVADPVAIPERPSTLHQCADMGLSKGAHMYLNSRFANGLYGHQVEAISQSVTGDDICMLTSTASGKSVPFYASGIDVISRDPKARVIAIYPLKALGREQEERWRVAVNAAGLNAVIGRIDGAVNRTKRLEIMRNSSIVIMTPDVIHAWLLSSLAERNVQTFLRNLRIMVVDEVHSYTGVFGSNSAFLFRRLEHAVGTLGSKARYICASATMAKPEQHLKNLFGRDFQLILPERDTSPHPPMEILLARPPEDKDLLSGISSLLLSLTDHPEHRFICFVDSRKQTEHISAIAARNDNDSDEDFVARTMDIVQSRSILPYRSGYEECDRAAIQQRLSNGSLQGVVSTSALEMGIDIPGLTLGLLVGVPQSATSLYQRIGRIGRDAPGTIIVINTGNLLDESVFADPPSVMRRPLGEGALYLRNRRIQYIHAMCLARPGGEHDSIAQSLGLDTGVDLVSDVDWPEDLLSLCRSERLGELETDLQQMKMQAGESPNHVFPLRDVESQYRIELRHHAPEQLGSLSHSQLMREAYPGAIYYHVTKPYRVVKVLQRDKSVHVRPEKRYTTKPSQLPTLIYPNLTGGNIHEAERIGDMLAVECNLQVREAIGGFKERRGSTEIPITYPLNSAQIGVYFDLPLFTRNFFTSGVIISHPALDSPGVHVDSLAELLYEAFVMTIPFERRDIGYASDRHRQTREPVSEGSRFLAIYDQTYGSLRLSGALMAEDTLEKMMDLSLELAQIGGMEERDPVTMATLRSLVESMTLSRANIKSTFAGSPAAIVTEDRMAVIAPGSKGWSTMRDNQVFTVEKVFLHPTKGLQYRGTYANTRPEDRIILPLECLLEIPGETRMGFYDPESGDVIC